MSGNRTIETLAVLALVIGGFTPPAEAQQAKEAEKTEKGARKEDTLPLLQYAGGTVGQYVQLIQGYFKVNILLDDEVARAKMPAVELWGVEMHSALEVVPQLAVIGIDERIRLTVLDGPSPVFVFKVDRRPEDPPTLEVFSLQGLLAGRGEAKLKQETILTAIEKALAEFPGRQASVKFHPESAILFVKGSAEQNRIVKQVIEKLEEGVNRLEQAGETVKLKDAEDAVRRVQAEKETLLVRLQAMESEMKILQRQNEELRQTIDKMRADRQAEGKGGSPERP
jgi:chaperonin cofactor prefoldin